MTRRHVAYSATAAGVRHNSLLRTSSLYTHNSQLQGELRDNYYNLKATYVQRTCAVYDN